MESFIKEYKINNKDIDLIQSQLERHNFSKEEIAKALYHANDDIVETIMTIMEFENEEELKFRNMALFGQYDEINNKEWTIKNIIIYEESIYEKIKIPVSVQKIIIRTKYPLKNPNIFPDFIKEIYYEEIKNYNNDAHLENLNFPKDLKILSLFNGFNENLSGLKINENVILKIATNFCEENITLDNLPNIKYLFIQDLKRPVTNLPNSLEIFGYSNNYNKVLSKSKFPFSTKIMKTLDIKNLS
jgi:hypothetical protein